MGQKTDPLALRTGKNVKNLPFFQQAFHKKYIPYVINDQENLLTFSRAFFRYHSLIIHSLQLIKDQKGMNVLSIKYSYLGAHDLRKEKISLNFLTLEEAFLIGLESLGYKYSISVCFFHLTKKEEKNTKLLNLSKSTKFFSAQELGKMLDTLNSSRGVATFLAEVIAEKMESLRSKSEKKQQGRFVLFLEKLTQFFQKNSLIRIKGLKIQIKGRINGIARSKKSVILFGTLNLQKIDNNVDFYYKQVLTVFGTLGIKVWVAYA